MHFHEFHKGIDLAIPVGTPVKTIADGRVAYAGWGTGYGKYVKVVHPDGFSTIYAHLSKFEVHVGEQVKQGEVVALSGNTGWSTGPHVYFPVLRQRHPGEPADDCALLAQGHAGSGRFAHGVFRPDGHATADAGPGAWPRVGQRASVRRALQQAGLRR
jgi:Membrane proteins related to metalloendopeptidases